MRNNIVNELLELARLNTRREGIKVKGKIIPPYIDIYNAARKETIKINNVKKVLKPNEYLQFYKNMCRAEFSIFEKHERRLKYRSPNRYLELNLVCKVKPPDGTKNSINNNNRTFSCDVNLFNINHEITFDECTLCNRKINEKSYSKCNDCQRKYHSSCMKGVKNKSDVFVCTTIKGGRYQNIFCGKPK